MQINCNLERYKEFLSNILVDSAVLSEILREINDYSENGQIFVERDNLYGRKILYDDYLEIKVGVDGFICNYTKRGLMKQVNIVQIKCDNFIKCERSERNNSSKCFGYNTVFYHQKIYNDRFLVHEVLTTDNQDYDIKENGFKYSSNGILFNGFRMIKKWYYLNGSVVMYRIKKDLTNKISDSCSICVKPVVKNYVNMYDFEELNQTLFKNLMLGYITIEDVIKENSIYLEQKVKSR